ncbi:hypothetical protein IOD13_09540 [Brevibacterium casei]|nr:hypothetical protein [Brevibacterium casei]
MRPPSSTRRPNSTSPVVFPESVYAFAGLTTPITADAPFAPVEDKGRIRRASRGTHRSSGSGGQRHRR